ncbi:MAG: Ig-like domain-containing protein, partial [Phycisphaerae bacterium]
ESEDGAGDKNVFGQRYQPVGDTLTYSWTQTGGPPVTLSDASAARPTFSSPDISSPTTLTFQVQVSDGQTSSTDTVDVTVNPVAVPNNAPTAVGDTVATTEDTAVTTGNVLANDSDPDGDTLSITGFTQATNGTVVNNNDGTFTYTPNADFSGNDSFTYTLHDGNGGTDTATVNVTVAATSAPAPPPPPAAPAPTSSGSGNVVSTDSLEADSDLSAPTPDSESTAASTPDSGGMADPPLAGGVTDGRAASDPWPGSVRTDSDAGDMSGDPPDSGFPSAGQLNQGNNADAPREGPSDSTHGTSATVADQRDATDTDPRSSWNGSTIEPAPETSGGIEPDGDSPEDAAQDVGGDVGEDTIPDANQSVAAAKDQTPGGVDVFAAIAGQDYDRIPPPSSGGESARDLGSEFTGADINVIGGKPPDVPPALAAQGFDQVFQEIRTEPTGDAEIVAPVKDAMPEAAPRGTAAAVAEPDKVLADGPETTDIEPQATKTSEAAAEPSRPARLLALMWALVRGTGGSSKHAADDTPPGERGQRSRRR